MVVYSEKYNTKYRLIEGPDKNIGGKIMDYLTNMRPCFFMRFTRKAIRAFFKELKTVSNIRLMVYTKLEREVCQKIL